MSDQRPRTGIVQFTSDRGLPPQRLAPLIEAAGFASYFVPEHGHIPTRRDAAHPGTGTAELPDERYLRTLDPWTTLAAAAAVTERIELATAVALPVQADPITLAKTIATVDHLSGGRVTLGVGFGWNLDELADHNVPAGRRRTMLREYLEAMRALWRDEEAQYEGEFVSFGPSWAWPKPPGAVPVLVGAGATEKNFTWIAKNADGWITTPQDRGITDAARRLAEVWREHGRAGAPRIVALDGRPDRDRLARWGGAGVTDVLYPAVDSDEAAAAAHLARLSEAVAAEPV
ncbi:MULTISPECIES: TIGR03619 family F420-dependent LLM class oxidoreductase [Tsukamurella]|uniref:TIGR03619 family F420-dependent LLM class oxidoreductase n=2 Tax=Tsukamurella TaxID=2060 RepID=A0A5C5S149_9ACTN|nr:MULTISPECIES: TIGR03619 family F420-dependent LLM class oxidoreductase [Tsukamurella]NMD54724.1 TIGR03619 family F420-dependent LLM class oxidoreductase [Tsukamurella columbiensis]TWS28632.1 TIGR03619 family F420-dependent LLM class oxidoreductase [Tsukamurella conjunctivitidis]